MIRSFVHSCLQWYCVGVGKQFYLRSHTRIPVCPRARQILSCHISNFTTGLNDRNHTVHFESWKSLLGSALRKSIYGHNSSLTAKQNWQILFIYLFILINHHGFTISSVLLWFCCILSYLKHKHTDMVIKVRICSTAVRTHCVVILWCNG